MSAMNHNHNHDHGRSAVPRVMTVRFEFDHPTATTVCVAGTFNDWHPGNKSMHRAGNGHWLNESSLAPGTYEYCLVVDGHWMPDPLATDSVPNPFGGRNSLQKVAGSPEAAHLAAAQHLPLKNANQQKTNRI
jgi:1,4-alpha-glucan branching enzyme